MAKFIKTHRLKSGTTLYINVDKIEAFQHCENTSFINDPTEECCGISTGINAKNWDYHVRESPEELLQLIEEANGKEI